MTRGPEPKKAKEESLGIAGRRGHVQRYLHRKGNLCEFTILCPGLVCFVTAGRLVKLSSTPEDILHDYARVIGPLRFIPSSPGISREIWLRTPRGAWRFFRILDNGLLEIDRYGMPLAHVTAPAGAGAAAGIVAALPVRPGSAPAGNGLVRAEEKPGGGNDPDGQSRTKVRKNIPAFPAAPGPEPAKDPARGPGGTSPVPENRDTDGECPVQGQSPAHGPGKPYEPDLSQYPGINLELIRRFMRWRKSREKNTPGPG